MQQRSPTYFVRSDVEEVYCIVESVHLKHHVREVELRFHELLVEAVRFDVGIDSPLAALNYFFVEVLHNIENNPVGIGFYCKLEELNLEWHL